MVDHSSSRGRWLAQRSLRIWSSGPARSVVIEPRKYASIYMSILETFLIRWARMTSGNFKDKSKFLPKILHDSKLIENVVEITGGLRR